MQPPAELRSEVVHGAILRATTPKGVNLAWAITTAGAVLMIALIGGLFYSMRTSRQSIGAPASVSASPSTSVSPSPSPNPCQPTTRNGCLSVTPISGPVGTVVVLEGVGCNNPGHPT